MYVHAFVCNCYKIQFKYFIFHHTVKKCNVLIQVIIYLKYLSKIRLKRHVLNNGCTDNMRSCDMREHSDCLRGILGYQWVQLFNSAIFLTLNGRT